MTCWHRLAPFFTQQSTIIYSLTINHPSDSISTIYPFMVCNKGRASCRFSHIHVIIMSCWILRTLRCPWSEGPQAHNTPDCVPLATHMHIKSLRYTDQLNLLASPVAYHHQPSLIYTFTTHHPYFIHFPYHIHYPLFEWSFDVAGQHSKEPLPMSQNHIIRAWMSHTGGWVLTATNAYSELAPDSNILCDAGIGTAIVWISVPILGFLFLFHLIGFLHTISSSSPSIFQTSPFP